MPKRSRWKSARDLKLPAFVHRENFDFTGEIEAESKTEVASYNRPTRRLRYANEIRYEAHAVLVGEYDHAEHPKIADDLDRVKRARLTVFEKSEPEADDDSPLAAIKSINRFFAKRNEKKNLGPMGGAFLTRNPLLPEDYFRAPEVDTFVRKLNQPWPYSLLECPGKYTVVVRTFESTSQIAGSNTSNQNPEAEAKRLASSKAWLDRCADDADRMVRSLRKDGIEAYQFHDRNRSLVTIGSFESLGENLPGGDFRYSSEIQKVMDKYRAFNVDPKIAAQAAQQTNKGVVANHAALIPFDVKPKPIAVPRFDGPRLPFNAAIMR